MIAMGACCHHHMTIGIRCADSKACPGADHVPLTDPLSPTARVSHRCRWGCRPLLGPAAPPTCASTWGFDFLTAAAYDSLPLHGPQIGSEQGADPRFRCAC